jgi:leucyl-tRNA synthetase
MRYIHADKSVWFNLKIKAKSNRLNQTTAEKLVWGILRNKRLGYRFRRQHVIYQYIVDFACLEKLLIIEIDGDSHLGKQEYDKERSRIFNEMGFKVIRFTNEEVFTDLEKIAKTILVQLNE